MGKYEEALERAKELHEAGNALTKSHMEIVFPELKESEDERIRKALVNFFKNTHDWVNLKYDGNEIVAYLEKQKEPPAEWSEEDEEASKELLNILARRELDVSDDSEWLSFKLKSWFKSLRNRGNSPKSNANSPHWKPSEAQISILGKVFAGCELNITERDSMVDLFYNLKQMI